MRLFGQEDLSVDLKGLTKEKLVQTFIHLMAVREQRIPVLKQKAQEVKQLALLNNQYLKQLLRGK